MDGVAGLTQKAIAPGETFKYELTFRHAGTFMYHPHFDEMTQIALGMVGMIVVHPRKRPASRRPVRDFALMLHEWKIVAGTRRPDPLAMSDFNQLAFNGKSFPATQPMTAKKGERVLIRYMNEGMMIHPMHLHGMPMQVIAQDGYLLPQYYTCDTLNIAPGQRFEAIVEATEPGVWAFHCHILTHAESQHGMFGMVTALIVEE